MKKSLAALFLTVLAFASCGSPRADMGPESGSMEYAEWFDLQDSSIVIISPYDGTADTVITSKPAESIVAMSSSYIGMLDEIGAGGFVSGVSGKGFVMTESVRGAKEVGYEAAPDYESILSLKPDIVLTYAVSSMTPAYVERLRNLGIRVVLLWEHLEKHPLARAEYVKMMGALTGRREKADSAFAAIRDSYLETAAKASRASGKPYLETASKSSGKPIKVLINIPYADQWFIPGGNNYITKLIEDAGGTVLGSKEGEIRSGVISTEEAYALSKEADFWLNTGWCRTLSDIKSCGPLFRSFPVLREGAVWNNTKRVTEGGGNDFWESGAARPDLVIRDLAAILSGNAFESDLRYYVKVYSD